MNVPAHDNSAMDGFAVRGADLKTDGETVLHEIGAAFAGRVFGGAVGPGKCVRVMTGAVMPAGTDTVVIQEVVRVEGDRIVVPPGQKTGQNRRLAGEDLAVGRVALPAGRLVRPAELGLLASLGLAEVTVRRRLRVAFFSTGDELASIGAPLKEGEVYDSNRYTLYGMLARLGVDLIDMGVVRDDPASLERAFLDAAAIADAVITSGGVSVGEADFTRELLGRLGRGAVLEDRDAPGPSDGGRPDRQDAHFFGLPGNPVAVMVTFYGFVRDALLALAGRTDDYALPVLQVRERDRAAQEARAHRVPARDRRARRRRPVERAHHRAAGLRRAAVDVGGELLHRARARARRRQSGRPRQRAAFRGARVARQPEAPGSASSWPAPISLAACGSGSASTCFSLRSIWRVRVSASTMVLATVWSCWRVRAEHLPELPELVLDRPEQRPHLARALLDRERPEAHLEAVEHRQQRGRSGDGHAVVALQRLDQAGPPQHLGVEPLGREVQQAEVGGVRRRDVLLAHGLRFGAQPHLQRAARRFDPLDVGALLRLLQALVVLERELGVDRQPERRAALVAGRET